MKMVRMACFSAVLVLAPLAVGKLPVPNETFGRIESALDFCSQSDPAELYTRLTHWSSLLISP